MSISSILQITKVEKKLKISVNKKYYFKSKKLTFYRNVRVEHYKKYSFPGRGEKREKCGTFYGNFSCECGHTTKGKMNFCYKLDCPICFHKSIHRTAKKISINFAKKLNVLRKIGKAGPIRHISFHTPDIKLVNKIIKKYSLAGILVLHGHRIREGSDGLQELYVSPHFHFVGSGYLPKSNDLYEKYGFTYHNIRRITSIKDTYLVMRYLLSHCAFEPGKFAYHWRGDFSHNKFNREYIQKDSRPIECKDCESFIFLLDQQPIENVEVSEYQEDYYYQFPLIFDRSIFLQEYKVEYKLIYKSKSLNR